MRVFVVPRQGLRADDVAIGFVGDAGGQHRDAAGDERVDDLAQQLRPRARVLSGLQPHTAGLPEAVILVVVVVVAREVLRAWQRRFGISVQVFDHRDAGTRRVDRIDHVGRRRWDVERVDRVPVTGQRAP